MPTIRLQSLIDQIPLDMLPPSWSTFDWAAFSLHKRLYDYQQVALQRAVRALCKYYEDSIDYAPNEAPDADEVRKARFFDWYRSNDLEEGALDLNLKRTNSKVTRLLRAYYPVDDDRLSYQHLINRLGFWMATGSGKTLVIVKLIQILRELIERGEIPPCDILALTHREDLLKQLRQHVDEFNAGQNDLHIYLRELREHDAAKREVSLFRGREITVFYYRSDNLSDERKEKIINFADYDNGGRWYVLLDEAHKGDKEDSKRQHIYSILARRGFLFNFSATFTDERDLATTVSNFNLAEFIKAGYGKHLAVLQQDLRAFQPAEDYSDAEKQRLVLKALLTLAYVRHFQDAAQAVEPGAYHRPLLLTLVNSVSTKDADLKLFFRELHRIAKGEIDPVTFDVAKKELRDELAAQPAYLFEDGLRFTLNEDVFRGLSQDKLRASVFNSAKPGEIEVLVRAADRKEIAFQLKGADQPFALIKIGDIADWLKTELSGYEQSRSLEDEGYFASLNRDSDINILMGSRSFYEGWDSNRPNVINFVNIGVGADAQKFIRQSIGRGVRIEPFKNQRQRLQTLVNAQQVEAAKLTSLREASMPLESLFIFATNRDAIQLVLSEMDEEGGGKHEQVLDIQINDATAGRLLLVPVYRAGILPFSEQSDPKKFELAQDDLGLLRDYLDYVADDRVLLALHRTAPRPAATLRHTAAESNRYFVTPDKPRHYKHVNILVRRVLEYFALTPQEIDRVRPLQDEIQHFRHIKVDLTDITELSAMIKRIREYQPFQQRTRELLMRYETKQLSMEDYLAAMTTLAQAVQPHDEFTHHGQTIKIHYVAEHYYLPLIFADPAQRVDYIQHIITEESEVLFIKRLEDYLAEPGQRFADFDWWLFCKLDETLDQVYIPWYNPQRNNIDRFKPDFIFWLQKDQDYHIVFVDPKGIQNIGWEHKIQGYRDVFEADDQPRVIPYGDVTVRVSALLYTSDVNQIPVDYRRHWIDSIVGIVEKLPL